LTQGVEEVDFIGSGVVEEPKDFHNWVQV
jgi:hypothetical protein